MIPLTLAEVAAATGGRLDAVPDPQAQVTGAVVVDSREAGPGALFVARAGETRDGHEFAATAVEAGAVAVLAARAVGVPAVVVDDTEQAFGRLARVVVDRLKSALDGEASLGRLKSSVVGERRGRSPSGHGGEERLDRLGEPTVVAVTGSSGKTTTKDLLAQVLEPLGPVVAPPGSYNTEVGVPLTVLRADGSTRTLVIEMGARRAGHIGYLCEIVPPDVGVVLNVGSAHLGEFGDRETIARAKGELVEALPEDGTAVLNADDPVVRRMAERSAAQVLMVGESVHADIRAEDVRVDGSARASFSLVTPQGTANTSLRLVGEHQVGNALAVAGVAHALGMSVDDIADGLTRAEAKSKWRMEVVRRADGVTVVNDAYNANPESMRAALKTLVAIKASDPPGARAWAVLGEMLELGTTSPAEHEAIGQLAARLNVARLVTVGAGAQPIHQGAVQEDSWAGEAVAVPDIEAALSLLRSELRPGDVVLVKSSRDAGLRHLGDRLVEGGGRP